MTAPEVVTAIIALIGGGGGVIAWARYAGEVRKHRREEDALRWRSKKELRDAADVMAQSIWAQLSDELRDARDELRAARETIEAQRAEVQTILTRLGDASAALIETERSLARALAEVDRKESLIVKLQAEVSVLGSTVSELRRQLAECTGATGASSD